MSKIYTNEEIAKQRELDKINKEKEWENLTVEAGGGERGRAISDAFKQLYTLYTPGLAEWFAKLYDPEVGGYYSTTSGHDTEGFGPDAEVTVQSLRFIESSGMLREVGELNDALPEGMCEAMLRFAKGLQNKNGYFYHPQWTFDDVHYNLARRGRDLGWATSLISTMGGQPTYDTPNGKKGDGLDVWGNPVEPACSLCSSEQAAKPAAASNYPEYLENKETFLNYLSKINIRDNSYSVGNQFNATYTQIKARSDALIAQGADYSLCETLINWLNERIDPNTGYWGADVNLAGTNGFFKIITIYNVWGYSYPMPEKATEAILHNIMGDEIAAGNCCSIYNLWCAICSVKKNVTLNPDKALQQRVLNTIDETLREKGAEAILNTYKKMIPYQKNGCAFSHSYTSCGGTQQGLYTGLSPTYGVLEGNVDATCICSTGLTRTMFEAFGFKRVSMLMKADWMNYKNILMTYGPAKKIRKQNPLVSFEDGVVPPFFSSTNGAELKVENRSLVISSGGAESGAYICPTARICKGDFFLFEADVSFADVIDGSTFRLGVRSGKLSDKKYTVYFDISVRDGRLSLGCDRWETGFTAADCASADGFKLRVEYYLDSAARLDGEKKKCSAMRVYADGALLGSVINNDGRDPAFPTGFTLGATNWLSLVFLSESTGSVILKNVKYSYADKQA